MLRTLPIMAKQTLDKLFSFEPYRPLAGPKCDEQYDADLASLPTCSGDECARALERPVPIETLADILAKSGLSPKAFLGQLRIQ